LKRVNSKPEYAGLEFLLIVKDRHMVQRLISEHNKNIKIAKKKGGYTFRVREASNLYSWVKG